MPKKKPSLPDFDAMTPEQRLQCHFAIWESMDRHAERESAIPEWHADAVNERVAEYKAGKMKTLTPEEFEESLRRARKSDVGHEKGSEWEDELAQERLRRMESGEAELLTLEEFAERLRKRWA